MALSQKTIVIIDEFTLPEDEIKIGNSQKIFTDEIVRKAKLMADNYFDLNDRYMFRYKEDKKTTTNCDVNIPFIRELTGEITSRLSLKTLKEINNSWNYKDVVIPNYNVYVGDIVNYTLKNTIRISGNIIKDKDKYIIRVAAKFPRENTAYVSEYKASDLVEAEERGAELILKYVDPAIFAVIKGFDDPENVEDAINIVQRNQLIKDNASFLLNILFGFVALNDPAQTGTENVFLARENFKKALEKDRDNRLAIIGDSIVDIILFKRLHDSKIEVFRKQGEKHKNDAIRKIEGLLPTVNGYNLAHAYLILKTIYEIADEKDKVEDAWKNVVLNSGYDKNMLLGFISYKIDQKEFDIAEKALELIYLNENTLSKDRSENGNGIFAIADFLSPEYLLGKSLLLAERENNIEAAREYTQILKSGGDPCSLFNWAKYLSYKAKEESNHNTASLLLKESDVFFYNAERYGMRGFHFYNDWAGTLLDSHLNESAIEKYKQALKYHGVNSWALLNWGIALQKLNRYKEAEEKFKESLQNGTVQRAVEGYLYSIYEQKDYRRFLDEYHKFDVDVESDKRIKLYVGFSYCAVNNQIMAERFLSEIKDNNDILNEERESLHECIKNIRQ